MLLGPVGVELRVFRCQRMCCVFMKGGEAAAHPPVRGTLKRTDRTCPSSGSRTSPHHRRAEPDTCWKQRPGEV